MEFVPNSDGDCWGLVFMTNMKLDENALWVWLFYNQETKFLKLSTNVKSHSNNINVM